MTHARSLDGPALLARSGEILPGALQAGDVLAEPRRGARGRPGHAAALGKRVGALLGKRVELARRAESNPQHSLAVQRGLIVPVGVIIS